MPGKSPAQGRGQVLVSWIAVNNDPYERARDGGSHGGAKGERVSGPTLSLLFEDDSPHMGQVGDVVLLYRQPPDGADDRETKAVTQTTEEIRRRDPSIRVHLVPWVADDPTDHRAIFEFLQSALPGLRRGFAEKTLVVHISPGTPSMQTIWVLMAETGFVEPPFLVVKSYRKVEKGLHPLVVPVHLDIETFYKAYKAARPRQASSEDQRLVWDPARFLTDAMRSLFSEARRFAQLNVPVLILGERGTGKTTLAGWLRLHSPYRRKAQDAHWPAVACGQYSPETMRAELFGYRKGAFTGANRDSDGLLAAADGDTLFLDEIGDVSRDLQRLLIKALEEKQYLPLGGDQPRKSNFRLIAATNIEQEELCRRLDPDFLDRISLLTLRIPPLREVRGELAWLWPTIFAQASVRAEVDVRGTKFGDAQHRRVVDALSEHPLPGNMRDLFRVAYRVLAAIGDPHAPFSPDDAVVYGLQALSDAGGVRGDRIIAGSRATAKAFAESLPLDGVLEAEGRLATKAIDRELKTYMADELRRIAKAKGICVENLCDVTERTLRTWKDENRK